MKHENISFKRPDQSNYYEGNLITKEAVLNFKDSLFTRIFCFHKSNVQAQVHESLPQFLRSSFY